MLSVQSRLFNCLCVCLPPGSSRRGGIHLSSSETSPVAKRNFGEGLKQQLTTQEGPQQPKRSVCLLGKLQVTIPCFSTNASRLIIAVIVMRRCNVQIHFCGATKRLCHEYSVDPAHIGLPTPWKINNNNGLVTFLCVKRFPNNFTRMWI